MIGTTRHEQGMQTYCIFIQGGVGEPPVGEGKGLEPSNLVCGVGKFCTDFQNHWGILAH